MKNQLKYNNLVFGMQFAVTKYNLLEEYKMRKIFILMLFVLNLVSLNHVMAITNIDQTMIFNDEEKSEEEEKGEEKNPEDECE